MARSKKLVKRKARKPRKGTKGIRTTGESATSQSTGSIGSTIARSVRSIVGCLPGAPVTTVIADFIFKGLGWSNLVSVDNDQLTADDVAFVGTTAKFVVTRSAVLIGCPLVTTTQRKIELSSLNCFTCEFREVRIIELIIKLVPVNPASERSGYWSMGFQPFYSEEVALRFTVENYLPDKINIKKLPFSVSGSASRPLVIRYRPTMHDGLAFQFDQIGEAQKDGLAMPTKFGGIMIVYEEPNRLDYKEFNAREFAASVTYECRVAFRDPIVASDAVAKEVQYRDYTYDVLAPIGAQIQTKDNMYLMSAKGWSCSPNSDKTRCKISGSILKQLNPVSTDYEMV